MDKRSIISYSVKHRPILPNEKINALSVDVQKMTALGKPKPRKEWAAENNISVKELDTILQKAKRAERLIVESNLRLVVLFTTQYPSRCKGLDEEVVFQEGMIGLTKAARCYDPARGCKFTTLAMMCIRHQIFEAKARLVNRNVYVGAPFAPNATLFRAANKAWGLLERELGRTPSTKEFQEYLDLTDEQLRTLARIYIATNALLSLNTPAPDGESEIMNIIPSNQETPSDWLDSEDRREYISKMVSKLSPDQQELINLRYGLDGGGERTLDQIGETIGRTKTYIATKLRIAIKQLKYHYQSHQLSGSVGQD
ncbi:sigma-70 family RNA polymerase sigma factor [Nodosilinea sp. LEGE 07298]|uniref:sigma-70 family RNA polymerase sigma factor n=1 Tax=Nodosilinea sp. LEGE 07298 TaxID=2777970 RepID=UPI0018802BFC|nr:sigma-70 family RNA polymerase sigma factor [Nodosilinea sp. LEGE 07298]MBE9113239.1 sigma-70 family RNA polymerase sigma factor [Nodosilinea sp. LEGE 07298]